MMNLKTMILSLLACLCISFSAQAAHPPMPNKTDLVEAVCEHVVDGDTAWFMVSENDVEVTHKVRFIGIDTPETVHPDKEVQHGGPEASIFTAQQLESRVVWLEYDAESYDRYDRHLCYVWLEDGTLFNLTLIRQGYAVLMTYPPNVKYVEWFIEAQKMAREEGIGLWHQ